MLTWLMIQLQPSMKKTKARCLKVPTQRLEPYFGTSRKKDGPGCIGKDVNIKVDPNVTAQIGPRQLDQAYFVTRVAPTNEAIPSWTGFNTLLQSEMPALSAIGYLPTIDASPTEMETVKTILTRSIKYADHLFISVLVLVFDQAIYAKAQKIIWDDDNEN